MDFKNGLVLKKELYKVHELSLADSMIREIEEIIKKENALKVFSVTVEMGRFSGVERGPFEFAFPLAADGTPVEGSEWEFLT